MEEFKSALASKTIWGGIIAIASSLAAVFGYAVSPDIQSSVIDAAATIGAGIGGILSVYGRVSATKKIGK